MTYIDDQDLDDVENEPIQVNCNYVYPNQLRDILSANHLNILCFNIRSMKTNFLNFKTEILEQGRMLDVIGLCETKLSDVTERIYTMDFYNYYTNNVASNKGGLCIYIKENIPCNVRYDLCVTFNHLETLFIECLVENKRVVIGLIYHRPGTEIDRFIEDLAALLEKVRCHCILMGDFNMNILNYASDNHVNNFINHMHEYSYMPLITKPTRVQNRTATLLDHIWINFDRSSEHSSSIIFNGITDHFPVVYYLKIRAKTNQYKNIQFRSTGEQCDTNFKHKLENHNWTTLYDMNEVDIAFEYFNKVLIEYYNECYPLRTKRVQINKIKNPWITAALKESIRTKNKLYKKFVKRPITYGDRYRSYRNTLSRIIKIARNNFYKEKFTECQGDSKAIWKNINKILGKSNINSNHTFKINDSDTTDANVISNEFNNYFSSIAENISSNLAPSDTNFENYLPNRRYDNINWRNTTEVEIKQVLGKCNATNGGPDTLPMFLLKKNADILAPILCHLCNLSLNSGIFPTVHKRITIVPIYKSKDRNSITNYRPICLLNAVSKVLEKIASIRLLNHVETNNVLNNSQFAYRKGRSTDSAILKLVNNVVNNFEKGEYTVAVYLDLTKAFDCVDHRILLKKLNHYGVRVNALRWFESYLADRKQRVKFQGTLSDEKNTNIGVPQGSILGPLLFLIYFQDICSVGDGNEILFADDASLFDSGNCYFQVIERLNVKLVAISQWLLANKLSANVIKTEGMIFSKRNVYFPLPPLKLYGNPIPYTNTFRLLGVMIDSKLQWEDHIKMIQGKLSRACGILYTLRNKVPRFIARILYMNIAYPYLLYGNIIWNSCYNTKILKLISCQKRLVRTIMKKERNAHTEPLFKKLNLLKLKDINKYCTALYVYKAIHNHIYSPISFRFRNVQQYGLRNNNNNYLQVPFVRLRHSQLFIHVNGPSLWNNIPLNLRLSRTLNSFKHNLKKHYLESYGNA